jgi:hypothetical protein
MKRNTKISGIKSRMSRGETLPLLRGMFIFPESLKRRRSISGSEIPDEEFNPLDPYHHSDLEQKREKKDMNWTVSEESLQLSIS